MNVKKTALAMSIAMVLSSEQLAANPNGAQVVHGSASFSNPSASELNVTNSHNAIINWQQFGIGAGETTRFIQPSAASAVLNRVVGNNPSHILGNLHSNGRVFLINQNGILIGQGAHIDTAGFFGSTLNITDEDFLNGRLHFEGGGLGDIENHGYIHAGQGGNIVLIAPNIENGGVLEVEDGNVILAAGKSITITSLENSDIAFEVSAAEHQVVNLGQIIAHKGSASLFAKTLNHSGHIRANGLVRDADGTIRLVATDSNEISGEVIAEGGKIHVLGDRVAVKDGARIDASSANGGGEILVGGDQQGLNPEIQNATSTTIEQGAQVRADATDNGNGGRVIVFSENDVHVHGEVSAKGGPNGGDGGFVETSGLRELDIISIPDVIAASGENGVWLIDPFNLTIVASTSSNVVANTSGNPNSFVATGDSAQLNAQAIINALNLGTNVVVSTAAGGSGTGLITVAASILKTTGGNASLTFNAHDDFVINAGVTVGSTSGVLDLIFNGDFDGTGVATLEIRTSDGLTTTIDTNGGSLIVNNRRTSIIGDGVFNLANTRWTLGADQNSRIFNDFGPGISVVRFINSDFVNRGSIQVRGPVDFVGSGASSFQNAGFLGMNRENIPGSSPRTSVVIDTNTLAFDNFGEIDLEFDTELDFTADASQGLLVLPSLSMLSGAGTVFADVTVNGGVVVAGNRISPSGNLSIDGLFTINSGLLHSVIAAGDGTSVNRVLANSARVNGGTAAFVWSGPSSMIGALDGDQFSNFVGCTGAGCLTGPGFDTIVHPIGVLQGQVLDDGLDGLVYRTTSLDPNGRVLEFLSSSNADWSNASNWINASDSSPASVPVAGDYVFIGSHPVNVDVSTAALAGFQAFDEVLINPNASLNSNGDVILLDGAGASALVRVDGDASGQGAIGGTGVVYNFGPRLFLNGGEIQADLVNWSDIDVVGAGSEISGDFVNRGLVVGAQHLTVNGNFNWGGGTVTGNGPGFTTNGVTNITSGVMRADWLIAPNAVVNWSGSNSDIFDIGDSSITNQGAFNVSSFVSSTPTGPLPNPGSAFATSFGVVPIIVFSGGQSPVVSESISLGLQDRNLPGSASFTNQGKLTIDAGLAGQTADTIVFNVNFTNDGGAIIVNSGSFSLGGKELVLDQSTESLQGFGTFIGNVINSAGLVSPGLTDSATGVAQTGTLTIQGNYTQGANGTMSFKLDATGASLLHDVLNVTGQVAADGTVSFSLVNGSTAERANQLIGPDFSPLRFGSFSGTFSTVQIPTGLNIVFNPDGTFGIPSASIATFSDPQRDIINSLLAGLFESELLKFDDLIVSMNFSDQDGEILEEDEEKKKLGGRLVCK